MNTSQLIVRVRDLVDAGESVGSGPFTDEEILRALNNALDWIYAHQIRMQPLSLVQVSTLRALGITEATTISTGLLKVTLPEYVSRIIRIEDTSYNELDFTDDLSDFGGRNRSVMNNSDYSFTDLPFQGIVGNGNDLIFRGTQSLSYDLRIWYVHRPPRLARFTATGGSTTTITADADDSLAGDLIWRGSYYVGGYVEVTAADEAAPIGDIRRISASARAASYPGFTLTVDSAFTAAVGEGDTIDMIPQIDSMFHELPCYLAASRLADRLESATLKAQLREFSSLLFEQWASLSSVRQSAQPARAYRTK